MNLTDSAINKIREMDQSFHSNIGGFNRSIRNLSKRNDPVLVL